MFGFSATRVTVLGRVRAVVDADAEDLAGIGDDGKIFEPVERQVGLGAVGELQHLVERVVFGERVLQRAAAAAQAIGERDDAHVGDDTEGGLAAGEVAREFHVLPSTLCFGFLRGFFAGCFAASWPRASPRRGA